MTPYETIAVFYDAEHDPFEADIALYLQIAGKVLQPGECLLDMCCGTGRISARLAGEGYQVLGVDISSAMLVRAEARLRREGLLERVALLRQDMRTFQSAQRF